ncbi:MAG: hypothetical protein H6747_14550 [Deltaproteobacteria bacterium]|nr:hypothetical protein [Deltaproteobacteria bacterium]
MFERRSLARVALVLAVAAVGAAVAVAPRTAPVDPVLAAQRPPVIAAGEEKRLLGLLADVGFERELQGGLTIDGASIDAEGVVFSLRRAGGDAQVLGRLRLSRKTSGTAGGSASFDLGVEVEAGAPAAVGAVLERAAESVRAHDGGDFYRVDASAAVEPVQEVSVRWRPSPARSYVAILGLTALCWAVVAWALFFGVAGAAPPAAFVLRPTHLLPAGVQSVIYGYWGLHWPGLWAHLPQVGLEIAFAYGFDAALALRRGQTWRIGVGPLPIVLSTNLLVLYGWAEWHDALLAVSVAIASRYLLRPGGRHLFNPSALGLSVVGVLTLIFPEMEHGDRSHEMLLAPEMTELMIGLGVLVQLRQPVVLASLGAALAMSIPLPGLNAVGFTDGPWWAPLLLVVLLLLTDPATLPRRPLARLLAGMLAGLGIAISLKLLSSAGKPDFYGKAFGVTAGNLAARHLDTVALAVEQRWARRVQGLQPRWNRAHVATWAALAVAGLYASDVKRKHFRDDQPFYAERHPPLLHDGPNGVSCAENPLYCEPFRPDLELAAWRERQTSSEN